MKSQRWLALGLVIYLFYGQSRSVLGQELQKEMKLHGLTGSDAPVE